MYHRLFSYPIRLINDFSDSENTAPYDFACNSQTNLGRQCSDMTRNIFICSSSSETSETTTIIQG